MRGAPAGRRAVGGSVPLPSSQFSGYTWFMVAAANQDCFTFQGWDASVYLALTP